MTDIEKEIKKKQMLSEIEQLIERGGHWYQLGDFRQSFYTYYLSTGISKVNAFIQAMKFDQTKMFEKMVEIAKEYSNEIKEQREKNASKL